MAIIVSEDCRDNQEPDADTFLRGKVDTAPTWDLSLYHPQPCTPKCNAGHFRSGRADRVLKTAP